MIIKSNCANVTTEVESFYPQNDECKAALSPPVSHCVQWSESFLQVQTKKKIIETITYDFYLLIYSKRDNCNVITLSGWSHYPVITLNNFRCPLLSNGMDEI